MKEEGTALYEAVAAVGMTPDQAIKTVYTKIYFREGHLYQEPPGELIEPPEPTSLPAGNGPQKEIGDVLHGRPVGSLSAPIGSGAA